MNVMTTSTQAQTFTERKNVRFAEYQEVSHMNMSQAHLQSQSNERDRMEQRVKEQLMSDFYSRHPHYTSSTTSVHSLADSSDTLGGVRSRTQSTPTNSPLRERKQRNQPQLPSGAPSSSFKVIPPHTLAASSQSLAHSDSGEWTEYTSAPISAPISVASENPLVGTNTSSCVLVSKTDLAEFDPFVSDSKKL